jgi:glycylpeptide N-tetradecanoyltransferase
MSDEANEASSLTPSEGDNLGTGYQRKGKKEVMEAYHANIDAREEDQEVLSEPSAPGSHSNSSTSTSSTTASTSVDTKSTTSSYNQELVEVDDMLKLLKQPSIEQMIKSQGKSALGPAQPAVQDKTLSAAHKFWDTQPVDKLSSELISMSVEDSRPIEVKTVEQVKKDPYPLPNGYAWALIDVHDEAQLSELHQLLSENYVEDDDAMFRFAYSFPFLLWALTPPHYNPEWILGVKTSKTNKLVACITGVPAELSIHHQPSLKVCEINFLCIHKKLRSKRLAPVLIKEVTRRVNLTNVWQAIYTAGVLLPKPISTCRYYHRSINFKKLCDIKFTAVAPRMTMSRSVKLYELPNDDQTITPGIKPLTKSLCQSACALLNKYLQEHTKLHPVYSVEDFTHWFMPREGVIETYVVVDDVDAEKVTDLVSFYHLPSSVIGNEKHSFLNAAYSYYFVPGKYSLMKLYESALVLAKKHNVDVFNALDLIENAQIFKDLKFGIGDGQLHYYLYNWHCPPISPNEVGIVLL